MFVSVIVVVLAVLTSVGTAVAGGAIFTVGETVGGGEEPTATLQPLILIASIKVTDTNNDRMIAITIKSAIRFASLLFFMRSLFQETVFRYFFYYINMES